MAAFLIVGAAAVAAAIGVITARNVVHAVLWLIAHLCSLAVLYLTLQATFLGLVQVLIYAGAVMVLFLFVVGLLSARAGDDRVPRGQPAAQLTVAIEAGIAVAIVLLLVAAGGALHAAAPPPAAGWGGPSSFGAALFGPYLLPFEATALALLTALVGAVALSHGHDQAPPPAAGPAPEAEEAEEAAVDVSHALAGAWDAQPTVPVAEHAGAVEGASGGTVR